MRGTAALRHSGTEKAARGLYRAAVPLCLCAALLSSCTDPRDRPVAPEVLIILHTFSGTSPGSLTHLVTASDRDGLDSIVVRVVSADSVMAVDSTIIPLDLYGTTEVYTWPVPPGIPAGTPIRITAEAWDFADFVGADTLEVTVQSSTDAHRSWEPKSSPSGGTRGGTGRKP